MQLLFKYTPKIFIAIIIVFFCSELHAQPKKSGEIGISAGGSYYLGDINKTPFIGTQIAASAFYRHTFDTRFTAKGVFTYGSLTGDDANSKNEYQNQRNFSFKRTFYELAALGEYNFMRFLPAHKKYDYTPYIYAGIAGAYYPGGSIKYLLSIPFGAGLKYNINTSYIFGAFIGMRKTFVDNIDFDYIPPTSKRDFKQYGYAGNKDWYSIFGVSFSYKIKYRVKCPAFD